MLVKYNTAFITKPLWINALYNPFSNKLPFKVMQLGEFCCGTGHSGGGFEQPQYTLLYTVSGSADLSYCDKKYLLTNDSLILLNNMNNFNYQNNSDIPWVWKRINFDGTYASTYDNLINGIELQIINFDANEFDIIFKNLCKYLSQNTVGSIVYLSEAITALLTKCIEPSQNSMLKMSDDINKIINYITVSYDKKITLDKLSQISNISKHYLIKVFKQQTGITPYEYIMEFRLTKATNLLINTQKTIEEISQEIGIPDSSNFIKHFKNKTGFTPKKYRKKNQQYL